MSRPVHGDVHQVGMGRKVVVPQAVMHRLEVPDPLPGLDVGGDDRLREQVVAGPVHAVVVVGGGAGRQIHVAQLVVAGQHRPDVGVARVPPRLVQPGVGPELVGAVGHGVEVPGVGPGLDVPGPHPARHRFLRDPPVGDLRAVDHAVAHDDRRRVDAVEHRIEVVALLTVGPRETDHRIDLPAAVGTEVRAGFSGAGVDADQIAGAGAPENALVSLSVGPVGHPPLAEGAAHRGGPLLVALRIEDPQGLAGGRIDSHPLRERGVEIEHAPDHQRGRLHAAGARQMPPPVEIRIVLFERGDNRLERRPPLAAVRHRSADHGVDRRPAPRDLQVAEVGRVDLVERRVLLAGDVARIAAPLAVLGAIGLPRAVLPGPGRPGRGDEHQTDESGRQTCRHLRHRLNLPRLSPNQKPPDYTCQPVAEARCIRPTGEMHPRRSVRRGVLHGLSVIGHRAGRPTGGGGARAWWSATPGWPGTRPRPAAPPHDLDRTGGHELLHGVAGGILGGDLAFLPGPQPQHLPAREMDSEELGGLVENGDHRRASASPSPPLSMILHPDAAEPGRLCVCGSDGVC